MRSEFGIYFKIFDKNTMFNEHPVPSLFLVCSPIPSCLYTLPCPHTLILNPAEIEISNLPVGNRKEVTFYVLLGNVKKQNKCDRSLRKV